MKKISSFFISLIVLFAIPAFADNKEFTIINHFDKPLKFIANINANVLVDIGPEFSLSNQPGSNSVKTRILDNGKEAYVRAFDDAGNSCYWGVESKDGNFGYHDMHRHGIQLEFKNNSIVFCTTEEYKANRYHCLG